MRPKMHDYATTRAWRIVAYDRTHVHSNDTFRSVLTFRSGARRDHSNIIAVTLFAYVALVSALVSLQSYIYEPGKILHTAVLLL